MLFRQQFNQTLKQILTPALIAKARKVDPYLANGLQVPGTEKIKHIVTGVSLSAEFIKQVVARGADTIIVHHSLSLETPYKLLTTDLAKRLKLLLENSINLYGYHYVLDAHPKLGNNAQIAKLLGAKIVEPYFDEWGYVAKLTQAMSLQKLTQKMKQLVDHDIFVVDANKKKVQTLGIVSGGGVPQEKQVLEAMEKSVDVHITGEIKESKLHQFIELGIAYLACGHYATETVGIKALTEALKKKLGTKVKIEFFDLPNPL